jgi:endonuclease/exonuclease/phosphatase family metal-dependent hydrolase
MLRLEGVHRASRRRLRICSVHLDSDNNNTRLAELESLFAQNPRSSSVIDLIAGDINEDTVIGSASNVFKQEGCIDVLASLGNREPTHPFTSSYNQNTRWGVIDHALARGATPLAGDVLDLGVWSINDEVARIAQNSRNCGSDHFPIWASVTL